MHVSNQGTTVIEPSRGWDSEVVDDRHSIEGAGAGCREVLRTPYLYIAIGVQPLQTVSEQWIHSESRR